MTPIPVNPEAFTAEQSRLHHAAREAIGILKDRPREAVQLVLDVLGWKPPVWVPTAEQAAFEALGEWMVGEGPNPLEGE